MFKLTKSLFKKPPLDVIEKRRFVRFPIMYHLDIKAYVRVLPYYRSDELEAKLDNLSGGGMALHLPKMLPEKNFMYIQVILPGNLCIACHSEVRYCRRLNPHAFKIGIQFLDLPSELRDMLLYMSNEYIACGKLIKQKSRTHCSIQCSAYRICTRHEKVHAP